MIARLGMLAVALLSVLSVLPVPSASAHIASATNAARPNIVFILTDDLDAATYDPARFPALHDLMASQGVTFSHFFVDDSLCCPSRASILRGQYVHNTGVLNNGPPTGGFEKFHARGEETSTIGTWLHARGYRTGLFGKYLNGYPNTVARRHVPPGWDEWVSPSHGNPYSEYRYELNENGQLVQYGRQPADYLVDVLSHKASDFITRNAGKQPFFAYVAPYVPHQPATPAPRYTTAFPDAQAPRPPSFDQAVFHNEPLWLRTRPPLSPTVIKYIDELYRRRLQDMLGVEDLLRNVVTALRQTGQLDNTYIFLGSDNGFHLGQHRLPPGKSTAYDEDIRVPLFVRGPGVPRGQTIERFAMNVDLAPTFAALAGAKTPRFVDGRSLVPLLGSNPPPSTWRRSALVEHYGPSRVHIPAAPTSDPLEAYAPDSPNAPSDPDNDGAYNRAAIPDPSAKKPRIPLNAINPYSVGVPPYAAVRTDKYLYVEYSDGARQLYDTQRDPYELRNIISGARPSLTRNLEQQLRALKTCHGKTCPRIENKDTGA